MTLSYFYDIVFLFSLFVLKFFNVCYFKETTNSEQEKSRMVFKLEGESQKLATKVVRMQQQLVDVV